MEQRVVGKAAEIVIGQAVLRGRIEQHAPSIATFALKTIAALAVSRGNAHD